LGKGHGNRAGAAGSPRFPNLIDAPPKRGKVNWSRSAGAVAESPRSKARSGKGIHDPDPVINLPSDHVRGACRSRSRPDIRGAVPLCVKIVVSSGQIGRFLPAMARIAPYLPPNPHPPRAFGGKGAEGMKKGFPAAMGLVK
jgi:hypothetical protein